MSSVSFSSGAVLDTGGGKWRKRRRNHEQLCNKFEHKENFSTETAAVPNKSIKRFFGRKIHANFVLCVVLPVLLVVFSFPALCNAGKAKKDTGSIPIGNFSQSPTNHEEVQARNKDTVSSSDSSSGGDDFWVGSHKLEFKPHPLLMPSTQTPSAAQIPLPIIELGTPPTSSPSSNEGGEVDDLSESATSTSEEDRKGKVKTRKSRGGRKKSRDQRRMAHRTLWARHNAASNTTNNAYTAALPHNPYFLHNHHQISNQQQSPVILTAGSMIAQHSPLLIPPQNNRNDDSFHGSATNWNTNHPGNGIIAPNLMPGYYSPPSSSQQQQQQQNSAQLTSSSSQENSQQVQQQPPQYPPNGGFQQYPFAYPQFHQAHQQQMLAAQYAHQQQQLGQQAPQLPLQMPPLAQSPYQYPMGGPSGPEYLPQQSGATPVVVGGSNGPVLMYLGPGGALLQGGNRPSASAPIPAKPFNINDIPGLPPHLQYNSITGPDFSGGQQNPHFQQHHGSGGVNSGTSSGSSTNPQYFRNNFLRMLMDRMANMGRLLPIPFVTKYGPPPTSSSQTTQQFQGYRHNGHNGFSRRMKK